MLDTQEVREHLDPGSKEGLSFHTDDTGAAIFSLPPDGIALRSLADLMTKALEFPDAVTAIPDELLPASVVLREIEIQPATPTFRLVLAWQASWELIPGGCRN